MKGAVLKLEDIKTMACAHLNTHLFPVDKVKEKKRSKYNNVRVEFDEFFFDSQKECNVYIGLRMRLRAGEITDLKLQVPYQLNENGSFSYQYIADFTFMENGELKVGDAKGFRTVVYRKKKKLMKKIFGIDIIEY